MNPSENIQLVSRDISVGSQIARQSNSPSRHSAFDQIRKSVSPSAKHNERNSSNAPPRYDLDKKDFNAYMTFLEVCLV